jgi:hypothetical protein
VESVSKDKCSSLLDLTASEEKSFITSAPVDDRVDCPEEGGQGLVVEDDDDASARKEAWILLHFASK